MIQTKSYDLLNLALFVRSPCGSLTRDECRELSIFTSTRRCVTPANLKEWRRGIWLPPANPCSKAGLYGKSPSIHPQDAELIEEDTETNKHTFLWGPSQARVEVLLHNQTLESVCIWGMDALHNLCFLPTLLLFFL